MKHELLRLPRVSAPISLFGPGSITNAALPDSSGQCRIALSWATHGPFAAMAERGHVVARPASVDANQENQRPPM